MDAEPEQRKEKFRWRRWLRLLGMGVVLLLGFGAAGKAWGDGREWYLTVSVPGSRQPSRLHGGFPTLGLYNGLDVKGKDGF